MVYYILPESVFFLELILGIKSQYQIEKDFSSLTIILPNNRAVRNLKQAFLSYSKDNNIKLPKIYSIFSADDGDSDSPVIEPPSKLEQKLFFAKIYSDKYKVSFKKALEHYDYYFEIMNLAYQYGFKYEDLNKIDSSFLPMHFAKVQDYIKFAIDTWPEFVRAKGEASFVDYMSLQVMEIRKMMKKGKVIFAGFDSFFRPMWNIFKESLEYNFSDNQDSYAGNMVVFKYDPDISKDEYSPYHNLKELIDYLGYSVSPLNDGIRQNKKKPHLIEFDYPINEASKIVELALNKSKEDLEVAIVTDNAKFRGLLYSVFRSQNIIVDSSDGIIFSTSRIYGFMVLLAKLISKEFDAISLYSVVNSGIIKQIDKNSEKDVNEFTNKILRSKEVMRSYADIEKACILFDDPNIREIFNIFKKEIIDKVVNIPVHTDINSLVSIHKEISESLLSKEIFSNYEKEIYDQIVTELDHIKKYNFQIKREDYIEIFCSIFSNKSIYDPEVTVKNIKILTPKEAYLSDFDVAIIANCNDDSWIENTINPFFPNYVKEQLGIPNYKDAIFLSHYYFSMISSKKEIYYTRSLKENGRSTEILRWVRKMIIENDIEIISDSNNDHKDIEYKYHQLEEVNPDMTLRPKEMSAYDIDLYQENPYEIYIEKVLGLKQQQPVNKDHHTSEYNFFVRKFIDYAIGNINDIRNLEEAAHNIGRSYMTDTIYQYYKDRIASLTSFLEDFLSSFDIRNIIRNYYYNLNVLDVRVTGFMNLINIDKDKIELFYLSTKAIPTQKSIIDYKFSNFALSLIALEDYLSNRKKSIADKKIVINYIKLNSGPDISEKLVMEFDYEYIINAKVRIAEIVYNYLHKPFRIDKIYFQQHGSKWEKFAKPEYV